MDEEVVEEALTRWLATVESAFINDMDGRGEDDEGAASSASAAMSSLSVGGEADVAGGVALDTTRGEALHDDADDTTWGELWPIMMTLLKEAARGGGGVASGRCCALHRPSLVR